jgi:hypothetical protein
MYKLVSGLLLASFSVCGQGLAGDWQGSIHAQDHEVRILMKIAAADGDVLKATIYNVDQDGPGSSASSVVLRGAVVKIVVPGIDASYDGVFADNRNAISGNWIQGGASRPLILTRATCGWRITKS